MAVIAVINRKGGSGKSTLATNLAAHCVGSGAAVLLGDIDRQQSIQTWMRLRKGQALGAPREILSWNVEPATFVRPPAGIDHVILDTPGGLRGFDLARVVMYADAILMPVVGFDRHGNRLGMGAGYYDRALRHLRDGSRRWRRPRLVGLAFACQEVERIVPSAWDIPLDVVVTERGIVVPQRQHPHRAPRSSP